MKMKLFTLVALMVLGNLTIAAATESSEAAKSNVTMALAKVVKEKVNFPKFLKSEGIKKTSVLVEFTLTDEGKVEVLGTCNCDERIKDYIISQIEEIQLSDIQHEEGNKYVIRLNFELI